MPSVTVTHDETLVCCDCHKSFTFSAAEKVAHERNGYKNKPKRCRSCREYRRNGAKPSVMPDQDMLIEVCKAVGELRVLIEHKFSAVESSLADIEKKLGET